MNWIEWSIKRTVGVFMLTIGVLVLGVISLTKIPIDLYPDIKIPVAVITTEYSGAGPKEVEKMVTKPLEAAVSSVEGISAVTSSSSSGRSLVIMQFEFGTNLDQSLTKARENIDRIRDFLPESATTPVISKFDPGQLPILSIVLKGREEKELQQLAEDVVQAKIERVTGVASASIQGGVTDEILVELDTALLQQYRIMPQQIVQTVNGENASFGLGTLQKGSKTIQFRADGEYKNIDDLKTTIIPTPSGSTVLLQDIAYITRAEQTPSQIVKLNGESAVVLEVQKKTGSNTVKIADSIYEVLKQLDKDLPSDVEVRIVNDTSTFVRQSIQSVVNNMLVGSLFSVLVLYAFLRSKRSTFIIGLTIPIAIIGTFILMYFIGETLNILSMGGLALGIGMMVDNAIVVLENIYRYYQKGERIIDAAKKGASELSGAVIASTLTTIVVFLPIVFVEGLSSELFRPFSFTVAFALLCSLIASLTLIPMLSTKLLSENRTRVKQWDSPPLFKAVLERALKRRWLTFGIVTLAVGASIGLYPFIGKEFIPSSDQGLISIEAKTEEGISIDAKLRLHDEINEALQAFKSSVKNQYVTIGGGAGPFSQRNSPIAYNIELLPSSEREMTTDEIVRAMRTSLQDITGVTIEVLNQETSLGSSGAPIEINISGKDFDMLESLVGEVEETLQTVDGLISIENSFDKGIPELQLIIDKQLAGAYGLTYDTIINTVNLYNKGQTITRIKDDGIEMNVTMRFVQTEPLSSESLKNIMITNGSGSMIPLDTIAYVEESNSPGTIRRSDQMRRVSVTAKLEGVDLGTVVADIETALEEIAVPDGYRVEIAGENEDLQEAFNQLSLALILAVFLVYMVMAVQFNSFLNPLVIMFSVPTAVIGVFGGLFVTGQSLSVPAIIGGIMLAGIVVNNGIVLIDYITILRERGLSRFDAIVEAGTSRLRPILMTTLTTALGMLPLALGIGEGTEAQEPMAVVVIFGLSVSTVLTLVYVPVIYTLLDDVQERFKAKRLRSKQANPD